MLARTLRTCKPKNYPCPRPRSRPCFRLRQPGAVATPLVFCTPRTSTDVLFDTSRRCYSSLSSNQTCFCCAKPYNSRLDLSSTKQTACSHFKATCVRFNSTNSKNPDIDNHADEKNSISNEKKEQDTNITDSVDEKMPLKPEPVNETPLSGNENDFTPTEREAINENSNINNDVNDEGNNNNERKDAPLVPLTPLSHGDSTNGSAAGGFGDNQRQNTLQLVRHPAPFSPVLALPVSKRPMFPGFYKTVTVKDPAVIGAIHLAIRKKQPYVVVSLLKDDDADVDSFSSMSEICEVGVFCEITSLFSNYSTSCQINSNKSSQLLNGSSSGKKSRAQSSPASGQTLSSEKSLRPNDQPLTVVLYPLQRVKITGVFDPKASPASSSNGTASENVVTQSTRAHRKPKQACKTKPLVEVVDIASPNAAKDSPHSFFLDPKYASKVEIPPSADGAPALGSFTLVESYAIADQKYKSNSSLLRALASEIVSVIKDIASHNPIFRDQVAAFSLSPAAATIFDDPGKLADFAAAISGGSEPGELQEVLASESIEERLQRALVVLKKELINAQLQAKLSKDIESKIQKRQREYYLMEQMRAIKKELGIDASADAGRDRIVEKFRERLDALGGIESLPPALSTIIEEEMQKFTNIDPSSSEFNVSRNYLDWLTCLPWGRSTTESFELDAARTILDADHYGMDDVKARILEFIAVNKLRGPEAVQGKIICLAGPPGVGKTSIGKSIARALNREFFRFSVGGLSDVAEIKGHRRTYVGAMPGKAVQALKKVKCENPLILIDEIDKLARFGSGGGGGGASGGDPASALLELLDPEQNNSFLDHYLDVPLDLSKVLFMCTANVIDTIPGPLRDRMEIIEVSGYVAEEKMAIAERFLLPQAIDTCGLKQQPIEFTKEALSILIQKYCRESGVRSLKKHVEKVMRKLALHVVREIHAQPTEIIETTETVEQKDAKSVEKLPLNTAKTASLIVVTPENLVKYVGKPLYESDRIFDGTPPAGVVMGLAWTSAGGASLYIESVIDGKVQQEKSDKHTPNLNVVINTGQLGDVMKESVSIAQTFSKSFLMRKFPEIYEKMENSRIHLHVPDGATPKDGPSAGITMATSLVSLMTGQQVPGNIGMTGELTLTGRVLKIGGLKEKIIAAKRSALDTVIFPKANEPDWCELPDFIREGIKPIMVSTYEEVFLACFLREAVSEQVQNS